MTTDSEGAFARRLQRLITTMHPDDRGPFTYREIQEGMRRHGVEISHGTVHRLATGATPHPKMDHIEGLAKFFGVPVGYFFDEETEHEVHEQIQNIRALKTDESVMMMAQRIHSLSEHGQHVISGIIDSLSEYDQQPPDQRKRRKSDL